MGGGRKFCSELGWCGPEKNFLAPLVEAHLLLLLLYIVYWRMCASHLQHVLRKRIPIHPMNSNGEHHLLRQLSFIITFDKKPNTQMKPREHTAVTRPKRADELRPNMYVDQDLEVTVPFEDLRAPLQRRLAVVFGHLVVEGGRSTRSNTTASRARC